MPLLGQQPEIASFLAAYGHAFVGRLPRAVVVATAHWEEDVVTVSAAPSSSLLFDYGGFPPESYQYQYSAPGEPSVAAEIVKLLGDAGIKVRTDTKRGWDHGVFVPMMCMFPKAQVPIVQLSLLRNQDAAQHLALGMALSSLRERGVLIVGSGVSFHNFEYFFSNDPRKKQEGQRQGKIWDEWLRGILTNPNLSTRERLAELLRWEQAPGAIQSHPRGAAEHLMPLFVVAGAAAGTPAIAVGDSSEKGGIMGFAMSQFEFHS